MAARKCARCRRSGDSELIDAVKVLPEKSSQLGDRPLEVSNCSRLLRCDFDVIELGKDDGEGLISPEHVAVAQRLDDQLRATAYVVPLGSIEQALPIEEERDHVSSQDF